MVLWKMSSFDSFDEGETDFDSVVKDDGVRDVDDGPAGSMDQAAPAAVVVEEIVVVEALQAAPPPAPPSPSRPQNLRRPNRPR